MILLGIPQPRKFKTRANALVPERCIPKIRMHVLRKCILLFTSPLGLVISLSNLDLLQIIVIYGIDFI